MRDRQYKTFLTMISVSACAVVFVVWPLIGAIFWAVVIAVVFFPLYKRLLSSVGPRPNIAAGATVLIILTIVIAPLMLIATALAREASGLYGMIQRGELDFARLFQPVFDALPRWLTNQSQRLGVSDIGDVQAKIFAGLTDAIKYFANRALDIGQSTFSFIVGLCVMLYLLFFLLRDGEAMAERLKDVLPLRAEQQRALFTQFATVVRATFKGDIFVAIVQGTLGGVAFWFLGIHAALLWAALMTFASLLPAVGAALVWLPAAVYFLATDETWKGVLLIGYGTLVIGLIDNALRPLLVGQATKIPDYVVLISTLGGIGTFGLSGFIIGPLIAAMFITVWDIFSESRRAPIKP